MGDRGNIVVLMHPTKDRTDELYLYTHWTGCELEKILADALDRGRDRWNDESYLARIIFSEMIKDDVLDTTGYGISTYETDSNHPNLYVDPASGTVEVNQYRLSFENFIKAVRERIPLENKEEE